MATDGSKEGTELVDIALGAGTVRAEDIVQAADSRQGDSPPVDSQQVDSQQADTLPVDDSLLEEDNTQRRVEVRSRQQGRDRQQEVALAASLQVLLQVPQVLAPSSR